MTHASFSLKPITPHLGAEVSGIDLSRPLSEEQMNELRAVFLDRMVLVFRDQHLSREQHKAFARRFGPLHIHPLHRSGGDDPEILQIRSGAESQRVAGNGWHVDVSCDAKPPMGSMLYVTKTPEGGGGNTLFADMCLAYELLSKPMQQFLEELTAVHDGALAYDDVYGRPAPEGSAHPRAEHPVIARHPETGRRSLYVNSLFTSRICELAQAESRALLDLLFRHISSTPRLLCHVVWEPNTLCFWDNLCLQHHAVWDYQPQRRHAERVSIVGTPPSR